MEKQIYLALENNRLLENIDISGIDLTNISGEFISIKEGEILFSKGDEAESIYLVVNGEINLLKKKETGKTISAVFGENEFFGEEEFLKNTQRKTTAVAITDSYLIKLDRDEINRLVDQDQEIATNLSINIPVEDNDYVEDFVDEDLVENIFDDSIEHVEISTSKKTEDVKFDEVDESIKNLKDDWEPVKDDIDKQLVNDISEKINRTVSTEDKVTTDFGDSTRNVNEVQEEQVEQQEKLYTEEIMENEQTGQNRFGNEEQAGGLANDVSNNFFENTDNSGINDVETLMNDLGDESDKDFSDELVTNEPEINAAYLYNPSNKNDEEGMTKEQLEMIIKAAQLVNSNIKLDDVLKNIVDVAVDLTNAARGTLYLVDREKRELWSKVLMGD